MPHIQQNLNYHKMGNENSMIQTSSIPTKQFSNITNQLPGIISTQPFRKFGQKIKSSNPQNQKFILSIEEPFSETIDIPTAIYEELEDAFSSKTQHIVIEHIIFDKDVGQRMLYQGYDSGEQISLAIRPFTSQQSYLFDSILCQVYFASLCSSFNSPNLHKMIDSYIVSTPIEIENPNSYVLVMERANISLSQIISFKRQNKWDWQVNEFQRMAHNLISAVSTLHSNNIAHSDIRPSNIYFSLAKGQYQLGSYSNCIKVGKKKDTEQLNESGAGNLETDPLKRDIHALGMTLLSAYYLHENVSFQLTKDLKQSQDHKIFKLIQKMLSPASKRPGIFQIKNNLPYVQYQNTSMTNIIEHIYHHKDNSYEQKIEQKKYIGLAYQRLGLWIQWKKQYKQVFELQLNGSSKLKKADGYYQLALIEHCIGQDQSSSTYAKKAADKYRQLGREEEDLGVISAAEIYYKKALECSKYYEEPNDLDVSQSLIGLSNLHAHKKQYRLAKTLAAEASSVIAKNPNGKDSFEYCQYRIKQAKIQADSGAYQNADTILHECLKFADKKAGINNKKADILKATIYAEKGREHLNRAEHEIKNEDIYLNESQKNLIEALRIEKAIDQDRHQYMAQVIKMLGKINFKRGNYQLAIKDFDKSIELLNYTELTETKKSKQKPDIICLKALAQSHLGESSKAGKDIENALKIYRQLYGSDHNRSSALAIGMLGKVYENGKQNQKAKQCQQISQQLLRQLGCDEGNKKNVMLLEQSFNISQILHK